MTPQEQLAARKIAALIRAARKRAGFTQVDISKSLGISQSALSKVENGLLIPSAPQWFDFCALVGISPDSLSSGYIERNRPASLIGISSSETGFKLPEVYAENRGSKVRATLPFLLYFKSIFGDEKWEEYLKEKKIDPDFFVDLDHQISLNFLLDLARVLITEGRLKAKDFSKLLKPVAQPGVHGSLHRKYDSAPNTANLLQILVLNSRQYECNFEYQIEDVQAKQMILTVRPESHLKTISYKDDADLGNFLCQYKRAYFEKFASYGGTHGVEIHECECHYKGADRCVYQIQTAS